MKFGNWVPMSKGFVRSLPTNRPYSELEAAYCLQCDYDQQKTVTLTGYAALWRWGTDRVTRFLNEIGVKIQYPEDTSKKQRQSGNLRPKNQYENSMKSGRNQYETGMKRFIDSKWIGNESVHNQDEIWTNSVGSQVSTINLNPKSQKYVSSKRSKTPIPENFILTTTLVEYARQKGINGDLTDIFEAFQLYHKKNGSVFADWSAAWKTWIRKYLEFQKSKPGQQVEPILQKPVKTMEELFSND